MASNRNYRKIDWDRIPLKETTNIRKPAPPKKRNELKARPYKRRGRSNVPLKSNEIKPGKWDPEDTYSSDEFEEDSDEYAYDSFEEDSDEYAYDSFEEDEEETVPYKVKEYLKQPYTRLNKEQKEFIDEVYKTKPELLTWSFADTVVPGNINNALKTLKRNMGQDNEELPPDNPRLEREDVPLRRAWNGGGNPEARNEEPEEGRRIQLDENDPFVEVLNQNRDLRPAGEYFFGRRRDGDQIDLPRGRPRFGRADAVLGPVPPDPGPMRRERAGGVILPGDRGRRDGLPNPWLVGLPNPWLVGRERAGGFILPGDRPFDADPPLDLARNENGEIIILNRQNNNGRQQNRNPFRRNGRVEQDELDELFRPRGLGLDPQEDERPPENNPFNRQNNINAKNYGITESDANYVDKKIKNFTGSVDKGVKEGLDRIKKEDELRASGFYDEDDDDWIY